MLLKVLTGCDVSMFFMFQLNQEAFHYIGQGCPILQTLLLNDMSTITDEAIIVSYFFFLLWVVCVNR